MLEHRFRDLADSPTFGVAQALPTMSGFAPCPMTQAFSPFQMAQIQAIYRIAAERTREQLKPRRSRVPAFSRN